MAITPLRSGDRQARSTSGSRTTRFAREKAISEILRAIASSPTDVQPVLDAIAKNAATFCGAEDGAVLLVEGDEVKLVAHHGAIVSAPIGLHYRVDRTTATGRSIVD